MSNLGEKRQKINKIDKEIIKLLSKRLDLVKEIGKIKINSSLNVEDLKREEKIKEEYKKLAQEYGLNPEDLWQVFEKIIKWSKKVQKNM